MRLTETNLGLKVRKMLKRLMNFLWGPPPKKPKPRGTFYVMNLDTNEVLYNSIDWDEAETYAKSQVEHIDNRFVILSVVAKTCFEVGVSAN